MRIALVHSFYRSEFPSGENVVVRRQAKALLDAGHDVTIVSRSTDEDAARPLYGARAAVSVAMGWGPDPTERLRQFSPDVVHVHNLFPNIGDRWLGRWDTPVVATLHNYRPLCANGLLFREGAVCTLCPDGRRWASFQHACYRGSRMATVPLAIANSRGPRHNRLLDRADAVIALSNLAATTLSQAGLDATKVHVMPTGIDGRLEAPAPPPAEARWIAAGRFVPEKGFRDLVAQWPVGVSLDVFGDGPDRELMERSAGPHVEVHGPLQHDELMDRLPSYTGLVFSSRWLEALPLTVLEAFSVGLPVVARAGSAAAEMVAAVNASWVYDDVPSLLSARQRVDEQGLDARQDALNRHRSAYSTDVWVQRLTDLYLSLSVPG